MHHRGEGFLIWQWCKMQPYLSIFDLLLLIPLRAVQSQLNGSLGLKRGVHVQGNRASYGHFTVDRFHRLEVSVDLARVVSNYRECALSCVNTPPCSSFNVAATPVRTDGKYQCELLNKDKYSANSSQLVISQEHHHYSIKVLRSSCFPYKTKIENLKSFWKIIGNVSFTTNKKEILWRFQSNLF